MKKLIILALLSSAATAGKTPQQMQAEVKAQGDVLSGINSQAAEMMQPIRDQAKAVQAEISAPINAEIEPLNAQMTDVRAQISALYAQKCEIESRFDQDQKTLEETFAQALKATLDPMLKDLETRRAPILDRANEIMALQTAERKRLWGVCGRWMGDATPGAETLQMSGWTAEYNALFVSVDGELPDQIRATETAMQKYHSSSMSVVRLRFEESVKPFEAKIEELERVENSLSEQILDLTKQKNAMIHEAMPHLWPLLDGIHAHLVDEIISSK